MMKNEADEIRVGTWLRTQSVCERTALRSIESDSSRKTCSPESRKSLCMKRIYFVLGHAVHETGLQRQIGVGTPVSSQAKRALAAPLINRLSTAGQPRVNRCFCSSVGLHRISLVRASGETSKRCFFEFLEGTVDFYSLGG